MREVENRKSHNAAKKDSPRSTASQGSQGEGIFATWKRLICWIDGGLDLDWERVLGRLFTAVVLAAAFSMAATSDFSDSFVNPLTFIKRSPGRT